MSNKLKALSLGLLAALAMSAVAVSASAETGGHFISAQAHTDLVGVEVEQNQFTYGEQTVTCEESEFVGTTDQTTETEVTLTPFYEDCQANFITPATVNMNGCAYVFTVNTSPATSDNTTHLECPDGEVAEVFINIPFTSNDCRLTIRAQTPAGGLAYTTGGTTPHDILADITVSGIHVTRDGNSICGPHTASTGALSGSATLQGFDTSGNPVSITAT